MHWKFAMALLAMSSSVLMAQAPPVKMGLWEKTMTMSSGSGGEHTMNMKSKSCVTPETWQQMVSNVLKQHEGCNISTTKTGNGYSYSGSCSTHGTTMTMKGSSTIRDAEHIVSESHTTTSGSGDSQQMDMHGESHFVSSDCGSVKPGSPERER